MNETLQEYSNELYQSLPAEIRQELRKYETKVTVPPGVKLVTQGICPENLIIVDQGSVEISVPAGVRAIFVAVAGRGKVYGLRCIVGGVMPEIDVTTLEQCEITLIPGSAFVGILQEHQEMYFAIARVLSSDLKTAQTLLREIPSSRQRRCAPGN